VEGDLLMIMTQQEQNFTFRFIGSAAQEIINTSDVPVISIIPSMKRNIVAVTPY
jgi:nucleotide-binding universal stress UspA family protein